MAIRGGGVQFDFDPIHAGTVLTNFFAKHVYDGLTRYGDGPTLIPGLAEHWETDREGLVYTFELRKGVRFHDGTELDAEAVRRSLERTLAPGQKSAIGEQLSVIAGAREFRSGRAASVSGIEPRGQNRLSIRITEPLPFFPNFLAFPEAGIVQAAADDLAEHPVGTGPFRLDRREPGRVVLARNPDWWDRPRPFVESVAVRIDSQTESELLAQFERGEVDLISQIPVGEVRRIKENAKLADGLLDTLQLQTTVLSLDCRRPPFDDVRVRRALNHAVDRSRLNEHWFAGLGVPAAGIIPPGLAGHDSTSPGFPFQPDRARALLAEAGYGSGFEVEYRCPPREAAHRDGFIFQCFDDFEKIGVRVKIVAAEARPSPRASARTRSGWSPGRPTTPTPTPSSVPSSGRRGPTPFR